MRGQHGRPLVQPGQAGHLGFSGSPFNPDATRKSMTRLAATTVALISVATACQADEPAPDTPAEARTTQDTFWETLQGLCEAAHEGELLQAPEGDTQVDPDARLVVHFWECDDEVIRFPFHIGENRSRTWVFIRHEDRLELRHDHRHEDGTEEANTWYGDFTQDEGTANRQEFVSDRNGVLGGWRVEIHPGERYTYGTIRDGEWRHHLEFDLSREVETPPLPWGHDTPPTGLH